MLHLNSRLSEEVAVPHRHGETAEGVQLTAAEPSYRERVMGILLNCQGFYFKNSF